MAEVKCPKCGAPITYTDADERKALECRGCGAAGIICN
jgi:DNA-directed RNA polymerase subunit M/transcription elongation factor TFIIS